MNGYAEFEEMPSIPAQDIDESSFLATKLQFLTRMNASNSSKMSENCQPSICMLHLVTINVYAKFDELSSVPPKDIEESAFLCKKIAISNTYLGP